MCTQATKDQSNKARSNKARSNKDQSNKARSNKARSNKDQSNKARSNKDHLGFPPESQRCRRFVYSVTLVLFASHCLAEDWPQWLGPNREPVWHETDLIDRFPEGGPKLRWKQDLGGGYSSPAIANGRVFVIDRLPASEGLADGKLLHKEAPKNENFLRRALPGKERVLCLNEADGEILWTKKYDCPYTTVALYAIGPRCTPTVDSEFVYTLGAQGNLLCLRTQTGELVWSKDFAKDYGLEIPEWGVAAHPLVDGNRLICIVGGENSTVVAFDKRTGREIWKTLNAKQPGYCPPVIYEINGQRQLLIWDSENVSSLHPDTGSVHWAVPFAPTFAMSIGAPQVESNRIFVMAFNRKSAMIEVAKDNQSAKIVWEGGGRQGIDGVLNTAILRDGLIFGCGNAGRYICADLATGKRLWDSFKPSTGKRPAPWANVFTVRQGERYWMANDLGELIIARLSRAGFEEISRAHLIDPTHDVSGRTLVWSHPSFANRSVYLRNDQEIRCYSLAKE